MSYTLPISRSGGIPVSRHYDEEWGPGSVPPTKQFSVPWDEQVVPALRKKLELESQKLGKRITRIEESDHGWAATPSRTRDSFDHNQLSLDSPMAEPQTQNVAAIPSRGLVQHSRTSSIEQYHNRFGSPRQNDENSGMLTHSTDSAPRTGVLSTLDPNTSSEQWTWPAPPKLSTLPEDIVKVQQQPIHEQTRSHKAQEYQWEPLGKPAVGPPTIVAPLDQRASEMQKNHSSQGRPRTQSTPSRPSFDQTRSSVTPDVPTTPGPDRLSNPHQDGQEQQLYASSSSRNTPSVARRKAETNPKHMEEFGPLGSTMNHSLNTPRATDREQASRRLGHAQPDAFMSLSPERLPRSRREVSAPAAIGDIDRRGNDWEEEIVPTVARRLRQQQLLEQHGQTSRYEGLIDRWDKDGNPLSINGDILLPRKLSQPLPITEKAPDAVSMQQDATMLNTIDRSSRRSQQSSRHSTHAPQTASSQTHDYPMQPLQQQSATRQVTDTTTPQTVAGQASLANKPKKDDKEDAGCCCTVM